MRIVVALSLLCVAPPAFGQTKVLVTGFRVQPAANAALVHECADVLATSLPANHVALPKNVVAQELRLRGWSEPLTTPQLSTLARALDAPVVARAAVLVTYPRARQRAAQAELAIEWLDPNDESVLGGVSAEASVKLMGEASQQFDQIGAVVRELITKNSPRLARATLSVGKVLIADSSGDAHLSIGQRGGIRRGMTLNVARRVTDDASGQPRLQKVCEVVVREATDFTAIARPTTRGVTLQPLDVVTQRFELKVSKELLALLRD